MHGRVKVLTSEEQRLIKQKKEEKKLIAYQNGIKKILSTRNKDNYDPLSFSLSSQVLSLNPDIYTLWNYRKEVVLMEIKKSFENNAINVNVDGDGDDSNKDNEDLINFLNDEIKLTESCLIQNPKSYASWYHRYWILDHHPKPNWNKEFNLCNKYLSKDDRNFHCWDYRRLIVNRIGITLSDELKFSTERININFSNYSSWHYRSTIHKLNEESAKNELDLVTNAIFTDPDDSSAWFYLRWILNNSNVSKENKNELLTSLNHLQELEPTCKWIILSKCWLIGHLDAYNENIIKLYKQLTSLDILRIGYYEDCIIECK